MKASPADVVMGSRWELVWRLVPWALPAAAIVYLATLPGHGTWLLATACIATGLRPDRRAENHFFLAH